MQLKEALTEMAEGTRLAMIMLDRVIEANEKTQLLTPKLETQAKYVLNKLLNEVEAGIVREMEKNGWYENRVNREDQLKRNVAKIRRKNRI